MLRQTRTICPPRSRGARRVRGQRSLDEVVRDPGEPDRAPRATSPVMARALEPPAYVLHECPEPGCRTSPSAARRDAHVTAEDRARLAAVDHALRAPLSSRNWGGDADRPAPWPSGVSGPPVNTPELTPLTLAVIYAAKSTQDRHLSIPTQLDGCREKTTSEGWTCAPGDEFSDEGFSAYSGNRAGQGAAAGSRPRWRAPPSLPASTAGTCWSRRPPTALGAAMVTGRARRTRSLRSGTSCAAKASSSTAWRMTSTCATARAWQTSGSARTWTRGARARAVKKGQKRRHPSCSYGRGGPSRSQTSPIGADETREALGGLLRPGNAGANTAADHISRPWTWRWRRSPPSTSRASRSWCARTRPAPRTG